MTPVRTVTRGGEPAGISRPGRGRADNARGAALRRWGPKPGRRAALPIRRGSAGASQGGGWSRGAAGGALPPAAPAPGSFGQAGRGGTAGLREAAGLTSWSGGSAHRPRAALGRTRSGGEGLRAGGCRSGPGGRFQRASCLRRRCSDREA